MSITFEQRWGMMTDEVMRTKRERDWFERMLLRRFQIENDCDPVNPPCTTPVPGGVACGCALEMQDWLKEYRKEVADQMARDAQDLGLV
jgi:hypothetical protein